MVLRIKYLIIHFLLVLATFLCVQKVFFIIYNMNMVKSEDLRDNLLSIYYHGFALDVATAAYLTLPAFIIVVLSTFIHCGKYKTLAKTVNAIIAILLAMGTVADASLYEFWEFKLDATAFMYISDPQNAFASVSYGYLAVRFIMIFALSYLFFRIYNLSLAINPFVSLVSTRKWIPILVWIIVASGLFCMIRGIRIWPNTPGRAYYSKVAFFNHAAVNPLFNVTYSLTHNEKFSTQFRFYEEDECKRITSGMFPTSGHTVDTLLSNTRPNILFIVLEGFGGLFVENLGGMKDVGVNVSRISSQGVNFKQCYCSSFRTDRGIVSAISGYLGQPTTSIMRYTHKVKSLPGLPKTLKKYGYETQVLYASDITFFNMADYFIASGHDKLVSQDNFPLSQRTCKWGVPDHIAFDWLYNDILAKDKNSRNPWYTTFLTISSHTPFDVPYKKLKDEKLNAFAYTDECFGKFIDKLRKTKAWENLLIIVSADHGFNHREIASADFPHIPFFLIGGAVKEARDVKTILSQTDIPATILGQMGIPHEDFIFSRDVTSDTYKYPFAFNTFNNGFNFRDSTGCTVYDNVAKKAISGGDERRERLGKAILQILYDDLDKR